MKLHKKLALRKVQGAVIKCFQSLSPDIAWNNVKVVLQQKFSLGPMVTHAATHYMHKYLQNLHKRESLQTRVKL